MKPTIVFSSSFALFEEPAVEEEQPQKVSLLCSRATLEVEKQQADLILLCCEATVFLSSYVALFEEPAEEEKQPGTGESSLFESYT